MSPICPDTARKGSPPGPSSPRTRISSAPHSGLLMLLLYLSLRILAIESEILDDQSHASFPCTALIGTPLLLLFRWLPLAQLSLTQPYCCSYVVSLSSSTDMCVRSLDSKIQAAFTTNLALGWSSLISQGDGSGVLISKDIGIVCVRMILSRLAGVLTISI